MEEFTENEKKILENYVTNISGNIFVLRNLPEVIKGALFSRYSRSSLSLKALLLKEFILNKELSFSEIAVSSDEQNMAIKKAQDFYDRILDGYGDDSIGELGGAHLAVENVSMIAAKVLEDARIGGSPLEKSTRYIYFDQKVNGEYQYFREPILMTSAYRDLYVDTCNSLFETYSKLIPPLTAVIEKTFPKEEGISKTAYTASLRAKVLDCLRGLLPASTLTNLGIYGNGRFFEKLLQKLNSHNLAEMQEMGKKAYTELSKVIPSFIRRADPSHKHQAAFSGFLEKMQSEIKDLTASHTMGLKEGKKEDVHLVHHDSNALYKVAAALLYEHSNLPLTDLEKMVKELSEEELDKILDAACKFRENRRHKSPRGLEHAVFTFDITADFGIYRDLQRHRMLTQERQFLSCDNGYYIPDEIVGSEMEKEYIFALEKAKKAYDLIKKEFPEEAQYVVPMAYNIRWYFHVNLRALQWICELRSAPAGHPNYRYIAQKMAKQIIHAQPYFKRFFSFVDFEGYGLGRLGAEIRSAEKLHNRL
ncbi:MAG TPA: FAD-dependent thymidylate synthase [Chlamydiales bacterium]|nr:FAD-dependent thymidylate synthase [Chlamydiales bacterium]